MIQSFIIFMMTVLGIGFTNPTIERPTNAADEQVVQTTDTERTNDYAKDDGNGHDQSGGGK